MQRNIFCQGLQPFVLRDAMTVRCDSPIVTSHLMLNRQCTRLVNRVSSYHSFAAPSAPRDKKVTFDKQAAAADPISPVKSAADATSSKPP